MTDHLSPKIKNEDEDKKGVIRVKFDMEFDNVFGDLNLDSMLDEVFNEAGFKMMNKNQP